MFRGFEGAANFSQTGKELTPRPIIAGAFEGQTERKYVFSLTRSKRPTLRPRVFPGLRGNALVDSAVNLKNELLQHETTEVIPVAVYDLELVSDTNLYDCINTLAYAGAKNVKVYVNAPTIERWLLLHLQNVSVNLSKALIERRLQRALMAARMPEYKRPGNDLFFDQLLLAKEKAVGRCTTGGHLMYKGTQIPCMCDLISLIDTLTGTL
jgi:hypothetical protein